MITSEEKRLIYANKVETLFKENNTSAFRVADELGFSQSLFPRWKKGEAMPKYENMKKLSDFFGVPVTYFYEV